MHKRQKELLTLYEQRAQHISISRTGLTLSSLDYPSSFGFAELWLHSVSEVLRTLVGTNLGGTREYE